MKRSLGVLCAIGATGLVVMLTIGGGAFGSKSEDHPIKDAATGKLKPAKLTTTKNGVTVTRTLPFLSAGTAEAGGRGKELYIETYTFDKPMHGYSGHSGNYYCDYQRLPNRKCDASGQNCKIVSWTLQQICQ